MVIYATVGEDHYSAGKVLSADETSAVSRALLGPPVRRQQPARNHGYQYYQQVEGIQEQDRHCALEGNTSGHSTSVLQTVDMYCYSWQINSAVLPKFFLSQEVRNS